MLMLLQGQSVSGGHESCILAPAEAELTLDPMQPAVASTPPVSPLPSFGDAHSPAASSNKLHVKCNTTSYDFTRSCGEC